MRGSDTVQEKQEEEGEEARIRPEPRAQSFYMFLVTPVLMLKSLFWQEDSCPK